MNKRQRKKLWKKNEAKYPHKLLLNSGRTEFWQASPMKVDLIHKDSELVQFRISYTMSLVPLDLRYMVNIGAIS